MKPNSDVHYLDQLTWLRGIAAFLVICSHSIRATETPYSQHWESANPGLIKYLDFGELGVLIFFTLSGATLYLSNSKIIGQRNAVYGYFVKRVFRIWPAFAVSLLMYIIFNPIFSNFYLERVGVNDFWIEQHLREFSIRDILRYLLLLYDISETGRNLFNSAYWSLPIEFHYYFLFPVLLVFLSRIGVQGLLGFAMITFVAGLILRMKFGINSYLMLLAYTFIFGVLIAHILHSYKIRLSVWQGSSIAIVAFVAALMIKFEAGPAALISARYHLVIYGFIAAIIVFGVSSFRMPGSGGKIGKILKYYGEISYSTYLFHSLLLIMSVWLCLKFEIDGHLFFLVVFGLTFLGTLGVASVTYRYIELPGIVVGRFFALKWFKTKVYKSTLNPSDTDTSVTGRLNR